MRQDTYDELFDPSTAIGNEKTFILFRRPKRE